MVVAHETDAEVIGRTYIAALGADPYVRELYVELDRGGVVLWLLIDSVDFDATDRYYDAFGHVVHQHLDVPLDFHLVDPQDYDPRLPLVGGVIPAHAKPMHLRG
jgi:hypothetical protein